MLKQGKIQKAPHGMAKQNFTIEFSSSEDDEPSTANALAVKRSMIDATFICLACGGRGHASNVDGEECLTRKLGIKIPENELAQTRYPNGITFPGRRGVSANDPRLRRSPFPRSNRFQREKQLTKFICELANEDEELAQSVLQKFRRATQRRRESRPFSNRKAKAITSPPPSSSGEKKTFHMDSGDDDDVSSSSEEEATKTSHEVKMAVVFDDVHIQ